MTKAIEEDNVHSVARRTVELTAGHPVLLRYVVARRGEDGGPRLFHILLGFGEETLPVFSSWEAAQNFALANTLGQEWHVRETSAGELVSLLFGPCAAIEWVLLDPLARRISAGDAAANLMSRERFVDYILV